jgi:hypothetical protein
MPEVWVPASVVLGFQLTAFSWRIQRELTLRTRIKWVPPADFLNLASFGVIVGGVFVLPALDLPRSDEFTRDAFGLGLLLLGIYPFALAAHYRIHPFGNPEEEVTWYSAAEVVGVAIAGVLAVVFVVVAAVR